MITESRLRRLIRREIINEKKGSKLPKGFDYNTRTTGGGNPEDWQSLPEDGEVKEKVQKITNDINGKTSLSLKDLTVTKIIAAAKKYQSSIVFLDAPTFDFTFDRSTDPGKDPRVLSQFLEDINSHIKSNKSSLTGSAVEKICAYQSGKNNTSGIYKLNSSIWTNSSVTNGWFNLYDLIVKSGSEVGENISQIKKAAKNKETVAKLTSKNNEFSIDPLQVAIGDSARSMMKNSWFDLNKILEKENKESILLVDSKNSSNSRIISKNKINQCIQKIENSEPVDKILQSLDVHNKNVEKAKKSITVGELKKFQKAFKEYRAANQVMSVLKSSMTAGKASNTGKKSDMKRWKKMKVSYIRILNKLAKKIESQFGIDFKLARKILNQNRWSNKRISLKAHHNHIAHRIGVAASK